MEIDRPRAVATPPALAAGYGMEASQTKAARSTETSYIDRNAQENTVVLSPRLRGLIAQVGGCQTEHVEAVIRRVLYEVFNSKF